MSDARALLREQRAARRITHPYATYTPSNTLLCTLCRQSVKTESLWDSHLASASHKSRLAALKETSPQEQVKKQARQGPSEDGPNSIAEADGGKTLEMEVVTSHKKRKHSADDTSSCSDDQMSKRSKPSLDEPAARTPPSLTRRSSRTPSQGMELQIPSRPATPRDPAAAATTTSKELQAQILPEENGEAENGNKDTVDEDEWAAFEADIAASAIPVEANISAPAMSAADLMNQPAEEHKPSKPEIDLQDEREEAQRALEEEFDEMKDLEAKVLKLKERREDLRKRRAESLQGAKPTIPEDERGGKENEAVVGKDEESDDEDEDEDDWDGFRFRTR
ncbi:uncharacterized protein J7T54_003296 [Emericellopsis cladophorae]|uniref:Coiled-coil domain-containing protein 16 n=1 Tax=Emericellopsis cladophorae TaxID=2686198 RepID=A0A9P9XVP4_9HYPO|nr:uncharacterized protein J7T54_003296 [Emericellopsis cladophorae]KAI6778546.1 hypothetical protein J7T54_003296 [Emericellopsis cladophorae]